MADLDATDWKILAVLQEDARVGYRELARRIGMSPAATGARVRRLERRGVITGYSARVDPTRAGYPITAYVVVNTSGRRQSLRVSDLSIRTPTVLEDHRVTGTDDHVLRVIVASLPDLEPLIDELNELGKPATTLVLSSPKSWAPVPKPAHVANS
ncbi:Lrp/AsnC family transcriptional regulator [Rhodococcus koreensis]